CRPRTARSLPPWPVLWPRTARFRCPLSRSAPVPGPVAVAPPRRGRPVRPGRKDTPARWLAAAWEVPPLNPGNLAGRQPLYGSPPAARERAPGQALLKARAAAYNPPSVPPLSADRRAGEARRARFGGRTRWPLT